MHIVLPGRSTILQVVSAPSRSRNSLQATSVECTTDLYSAATSMVGVLRAGPEYEPVKRRASFAILIQEAWAAFRAAHSLITLPRPAQRVERLPAAPIHQLVRAATWRRTALWKRSMSVQLQRDRTLSVWSSTWQCIRGLRLTGISALLEESPLHVVAGQCRRTPEVFPGNVEMATPKFKLAPRRG